ncbi:unnamed protein product, partial [Mesorhabditis belari]|uniref:Uncharacterized protein n=1 Tax=Mesorhabditis belari TaxID=2138241 RepID=A0AAF3FKY2_9BILA
MGIIQKKLLDQCLCILEIWKATIAQIVPFAASIPLDFMLTYRILKTNRTVNQTSERFLLAQIIANNVPFTFVYVIGPLVFISFTDTVISDFFYYFGNLLTNSLGHCFQGLVTIYLLDQVKSKIASQEVKQTLFSCTSNAEVEGSSCEDFSPRDDAAIYCFTILCGILSADSLKDVWMISVYVQTIAPKSLPKLRKLATEKKMNIIQTLFSCTSNTEVEGSSCDFSSDDAAILQALDRTVDQIQEHAHSATTSK